MRQIAGFFIIVLLFAHSDARAQALDQTAPQLHAAVAKVAPIVGVSIGDPKDKTTWSIQFAPGATAQQISAAQAILQSFSGPVPQQVSAMQAKVALSRAGLLPIVQTWVNGQDTETQLIWNSATIFNRNSTLIANASAALGLTPAQIDQLFITASAINP